jgi:hypothetical protein
MGLYGPRFPNVHRLSRSRQHRIGFEEWRVSTIQAAMGVIIGHHFGVGYAKIVGEVRIIGRKKSHV